MSTDSPEVTSSASSTVDPETTSPEENLSNAKQRNQPRSSSLLRSSLVMASGTLVSRILGFIRAALLVAAVGSVGGGVMAAFQTANTLPNMVFNILAAGVLDAVLVPQIVRALRKKDGDIFVNRLLTAAGSLLFILTVLAMVATPVLIFLTAASYSDDIRSLAIAFALVCLPQIFFYGLYNLIGEVLNARGIFGPYMWAPVLNNVIGIAGLGIFLVMWGSHPTILPISDFTSPQFWVLAGSATAGVISQALILFIPLRRSGIRLRPDFHFRQTNFGSVSKVAGWTFATLTVSQVGIFSSSNLVAAADAWANQHQLSIETGVSVSNLVVGNAAYATSFMIFMVPQSLIGVSLATAVFTRLTAAAAIDDHRGVAQHFTVGVRSITTLTLLAAAILTTGAIPMMQLVLPRANTEVVESYAWVLSAFMPGVASIGLILMTQRVFFAYENAKPTFYMGIIPTIIQLIVAWSFFFILPASWWVFGAALSETSARLSQGFIGLNMVRKHNAFIQASSLTVGFIRTYVAAIFSTGVGYLAMMVMGWHTSAESTVLKMWASFSRLSVVGVVVTLAFFVFMRIISPVETASAAQLILSRFPLPAGVKRMIVGNKNVSLSDGAFAGSAGRSGSELLEGVALMNDDVSHELSQNPNAQAFDDFSTQPSDETVDRTDSTRETRSDAGDNTTPKASTVPEAEASLALNEESGTNPTHTASSWKNTAAALSATVQTKIAYLSTNARPTLVSARNWVAGLSAQLAAMVKIAKQTLTTEPDVVDQPLPPVRTVSVAWDEIYDAQTTPQPTSGFQSMPPTTPGTVQRRSFHDAWEADSPAHQSAASVSADNPADASHGGSRSLNALSSLEHPTKPALIFFATFTAIAFVWAMLTALSPVSVELPVIDAEAGKNSQNAQSADPAQSTVNASAPKIQSINVLSWRDDQGDNENHAIKMIDGDVKSEWHSRQFDEAFSDETAIAIVVKLDKSTPLHSVHLTMHELTQGGQIHLLAPAENPRAGEILASASMSPETVLSPAAPVELDSFVLRINEAPTAVDGALWAWIYEITVQ